MKHRLQLIVGLVLATGVVVLVVGSAAARRLSADHGLQRLLTENSLTDDQRLALGCLIDSVAAAQGLVPGAGEGFEVKTVDFDRADITEAAMRTSTTQDVLIRQAEGNFEVRVVILGGIEWNRGPPMVPSCYS